MAVITISYQLGSAGGVIARLLADRLHYEYVGTASLIEAAHARDATAPTQDTRGETTARRPGRPDADRRHSLAIMHNAVLEAALRDDVVLAWWDAQWLLRAIPHVLGVRIVAPFAERAHRLAERILRQGLDPDASARTRPVVERLLRRDDADKSGRMRAQYDRDVDDPSLYDVVLNNRGGDVRGAVAALALLARRPRLTTTGEGLQLLLDRVLASRVCAALMADPETTRYETHDVDATGGVVHVTTTAPVGVVTHVARSVAGVRDVRVTSADADTSPALR